MLKLIYLASLMVISLILFVCSKDTTLPVCKERATGIVHQISDSNGIYLAIITEEGKELKPVSIRENVILTEGKKVKVMYNIDSTANSSPNAVPVHIGSVTYLP